MPFIVRCLSSLPLCSRLFPSVIFLRSHASNRFFPSFLCLLVSDILHVDVRLDVFVCLKDVAICLLCCRRWFPPLWPYSRPNDDKFVFWEGGCFAVFPSNFREAEQEWPMRLRQGGQLQWGRPKNSAHSHTSPRNIDTGHRLSFANRRCRGHAVTRFLHNVAEVVHTALKYICK